MIPRFLIEPAFSACELLVVALGASLLSVGVVAMFVGL